MFFHNQLPQAHTFSVTSVTYQVSIYVCMGWFLRSWCYYMYQSVTYLIYSYSFIPSWYMYGKTNFLCRSNGTLQNILGYLLLYNSLKSSYKNLSPPPSIRTIGENWHFMIFKSSYPFFFHFNGFFLMLKSLWLSLLTLIVTTLAQIFIILPEILRYKFTSHYHSHHTPSLSPVSDYSPHRGKSDPFNCQSDYITAMPKTLQGFSSHYK